MPVSLLKCFSEKKEFKNGGTGSFRTMKIELYLHDHGKGQFSLRMSIIIKKLSESTSYISTRRINMVFVLLFPYVVLTTENANDIRTIQPFDFQGETLGDTKFPNF